MDNVAYFGLVTQREYCAFKVLLLILNGILYDILHHIRSIKSLRRRFSSIKLGSSVPLNSRHDKLGTIISIKASSKHVKCDMSAFILLLVRAKWRNYLRFDMLGLEILRLHGAISCPIILIIRDV